MKYARKHYLTELPTVYFYAFNLKLFRKKIKLGNENNVDKYNEHIHSKNDL